MNQKRIGVIIITVGILLALFVYIAKIREDNYINSIIKIQGGSCYLADGTCLHNDRDFTLYILGWALSAALFSLGIYLIFFDKVQRVLAENQLKVSSALEHIVKTEGEKDKFEAFLSSFNDEEKSILKAIKEQEGIKQATLRFRTGIAKSTLSLILKSLEEKGIISKRATGKTNELFLIRKF